jgi:hypothetical protein
LNVIAHSRRMETGRLIEHTIPHLDHISKQSRDKFESKFIDKQRMNVGRQVQHAEKQDPLSRSAAAGLSGPSSATSNMHGGGRRSVY